MMMQSIVYKLKKISTWILAGDLKAIYSMLMRHNKFAYYQLDDDVGYQKWWNHHNKMLPKSIGAMTYKPLISILLVMDHEKAADSIKSVMQQTYDNWQLCLASSVKIDFSDSRILTYAPNKLQSLGQVLNSLLELATGEYVMLIRSGDQL